MGSKLVAVSQICFMKVKRTVRVKSYCFPDNIPGLISQSEEIKRKYSLHKIQGKPFSSSFIFLLAKMIRKLS